ncbi:MAG: hypothetical protein PHP82_03630 [Candidatus ainarchaeum sp.]|nr:hypothetical protein [Candidatus ainarchaeum sp.]
MNNFNKKGFIISLEASFSLLMFSLILISISFPINESFKELIIVQQENDLLKIWSKKFPTEEEIIQDTKMLFQNASIFLDEKEIIIGKKCSGNSLANEAMIFDNQLNEKNIRIIVYLDC